MIKVKDEEALENFFIETDKWYLKEHEGVSLHDAGVKAGDTIYMRKRGGGTQKPQFEFNSLSLEGKWSKGTIIGDVLYGGNGLEISITKTAFEVVLDGQRYTAELKADRKLHWSDGDIWTMLHWEGCSQKPQCESDNISLECEWNKGTIRGDVLYGSG